MTNKLLKLLIIYDYNDNDYIKLLLQLQVLKPPSYMIILPETVISISKCGDTIRSSDWTWNNYACVAEGAYMAPRFASSINLLPLNAQVPFSVR